MSKPEPTDTIEIPIPFTGGKTAKFSGIAVFYVLLIMAIGGLLFWQMARIHDEIRDSRGEINCKLDLDIYMYGRPPEQFKMRDMPRQLFGCLPQWVGEQQIAPEKKQE